MRGFRHTTKPSTLLCAFGAALWLGFWLWAVYAQSLIPTIGKVVVSGDTYRFPVEASLPYIHNEVKEKGHYSFNITLFYNKGERARFQVIPDDCVTVLRVNSADFNIPADVNKCDKEGFIVELRSVLNVGSNKIHIEIDDNGGAYYGLRFEPVAAHLPGRLQTTAILLSGLLCVAGGLALRYRPRISRDHAVLALCLFFSVVLRLPYLCEWASGDEGAFLLLGRDLLQGNWPYLATFENKPPLVNVIYAFFELFASSLPGVRLMMAFYLGFTSYVLYRIGKNMALPYAGIASAAFGLLAFSVPAYTFDHGNTFIFTELAASLPLALMLYFALKPAATSRDMLLAGLFAACATLTRTNLIVALPFLALVLFLRKAPTLTARIKPILWLGSGTLIPYIVLFALYASIGHVRTLVNGMVLAPFAGFSDSGVEVASQNLPSLASQYLISATRFAAEIGRIWALPLALLLAAAVQLGRRDCPMRRQMLELLVITVGVFCATFILVYQHEHYLLQMIVPFSILLGAAVSVLMTRRITALLVAAVTVFALYNIRDNTLSGFELAAKWNNNLPLQHDGVYKLSEFMLLQGGGGQPVFTYDLPLLPYYMKSPIVTLHVFPRALLLDKQNSLLLRKATSPEEQIDDILHRQPRFIASKNDEPRYAMLVKKARLEGYKEALRFGNILVLERGAE